MLWVSPYHGYSLCAPCLFNFPRRLQSNLYGIVDPDELLFIRQFQISARLRNRGFARYSQASTAVSRSDYARTTADRKAKSRQCHEDRLTLQSLTTMMGKGFGLWNGFHDVDDHHCQFQSSSLSNGATVPEKEDENYEM